MTNRPAEKALTTALAATSHIRRPFSARASAMLAELEARGYTVVKRVE
jgi:hypothetical protein